MKNLFRFWTGVAVMSIFPMIAGAVGTYYNGNLYQNPQQRYSRGGYYNSYGYGSGRGYGADVQSQLGTQKQQNQKKNVQQGRSKHGFMLDAGLSHQIGHWEFDMNKAGSKLHYDNLMWNVFDANGVYYFGDNTKMQVMAGFQYGKQFGESPMIDDDVSGAVWTVEEDAIYGIPAIGVGTSKDGSQMGFNVGFGLTDFFSWGKMKITPSIGYRYFKHKLKTENDAGLAVEVLHSNSIVNCVETQPGEIQCSPIVGVIDPSSGDITNFASYNADYMIVITPGGDPTYLYLGQTDYYEQAGVSHEYETKWAGPYLALDMEYQINKDNLITGGIELGLPIYESKGNQPYRWDWAHPTSVEDKGEFGDAYHLGLNADWMTSITDSTYLSLGFTYDYYKVSNATAKTYLSPSGQAYLLATYQITKEQYNAYQAAGWTIEEKDEINSIYKSMGIRVGINMQF